jgi:anoctamin-10
MVIQFGYLALFSPVWPLVPIGFLVNNWFELRSDFLKICIEHQRPSPVRTDGIGPWVHSLAFLNWLGSISTAAIVHLFGQRALGYNIGDGDVSIWWTLPITIFVSEHVFMMLRTVVQFALHRIGSDQIRKQRNEEYARRKKQLDELEANKSSLSHLSVDQRRVHRKRSFLMNDEPFFARQAEEGKTTEVGLGLIRAMKGVVKENKKD